jgi:hypothetical protein
MNDIKFIKLYSLVFILSVISSFIFGVYIGKNVYKTEIDNLFAARVENILSSGDRMAEIQEARLSECRLYNKFTSIADEVGSIPYSPEANCYDHSKLMQKKLSENGIASSIFITPTRNHAFIGVWIEANTGKFISPEQYQIGEVRDSNLNVVCDGMNNK